MPRKRKSGPSAPCAGWLQEQQQAEADAADPESVLAGLRAGTLSEADGYRQLRFLIYRELPDDLRKAETLLSFYWKALTICIARLRVNDATDPVTFVKSEFRRQRVRCFKADSPDIRPSDKQKSAARKLGIELEPLRRVETKTVVDDDGYATDSLLEVAAKPPTETKLGVEYVTPSRLRSESESDMIDEIAFTQLERDVIAYLQQGETIRATAAKMGETKYKIEAALNSIRARALRLGIDLPEQRAAG